MFKICNEIVFVFFPSGGSSGGTRGPRQLPLFWVKKEEITEGRKAGRAIKANRPPPPSPPTLPPPPLAQGLDPPLIPQGPPFSRLR